MKSPQALLAAVGLSCACVGCVARATRVRTRKGDRRIEELGVGDEVYSVDPQTSSLVATRITRVRSVTREVFRLDFGERELRGELLVTSDHPLYDPTLFQWAPAGEWLTGQRTRLSVHRGERLISVQLRGGTYAGVLQVFDLTVEHALHNFLANDVLVHNKQRVPNRCGLPDGGFVNVYPCNCDNGSISEERCFANGTTACDCPGGADASMPGDGGADGGSDGGADGGDGG